jgi:predicted dehydrogenase
MTKVGLVGVGKMGVSHLSILGAHPLVEIVGVCDTSKMTTQFLEEYTKFPCFQDYIKMVEKANPDAVFVAVPTKAHYTMVKELVSRGIHVFVEKPFCLNTAQGEELAKLASSMKIINQVGYHNKFVSTFSYVKQIIDAGLIGEIYHFVGEAYGPVVVRKKQDTWRSDPAEGGGCLMDYASHVIDLLNYLVAPLTNVKASLLKSVFSKEVEDSVYALVQARNGVTGIISVNWSDETYRKMSTSVTIQGTKGKIISDANELKVFFNEHINFEGYSKGWNIKYVTELTPPVDFYLRGEEYSAQVDYFIRAVEGEVPNDINTFQSALNTDRAVELIRKANTI